MVTRWGVMPSPRRRAGIRNRARHRAREKRESASKGAGKRQERPGPRGGRLRAKNGVNHDRACIGSLTMGDEVLYGEVRDWQKGPPLIVANKSVIKCMLSIVERSEIGAWLS